MSTLRYGFLAETDCRVCAAIRACLPTLGVAAVLSFAYNLLLLALPLHLMQVFDRVLTSRSVETLVSVTAIALLVLAVAGVLDFVRRRLLVVVSQWLDRRLAPGLFERAVQGPLRGQHYSPEALKDLALLRGYTASPAMIALFDVPWAAPYVGAAFLLHPVLGSVVLGTLVLLFATGLGAQLLLRDPARWAAEASMQVGRNLESIARNGEAVEAMGMMEPVASRWLVRHQGSTSLQELADHRVAALQAISGFIRTAAPVLVVTFGAWLAGRGEVSVGAIVGALFMLIVASTAPAQVLGSWKQTLAARDALFRLKGFALERPFRPQPEMALPAPRGVLAAEALAYGYPGAAAPAIQGVSFEVSAGEGLAIIGASGSGKSTLARLLASAIPPVAGIVRLDGADLFAWDRLGLAPHIGYLPQNVQLFAGSVAQNIARMADVDASQVVAAAQMAEAHELILSMPAGYETQVGEDGGLLSAGHRQRIGLARALLGKPRLVVLDEPSSLLDGDGEAALARALTRIRMTGATVVVVTHRPGLLQLMDKVLILRAGAVQAFGLRNDVFAPAAPPVQVTSTSAGAPTKAREAAPA